MRGARSAVRPSSRRDAGPGCVCAAGFLPYAATAGPAAFEAPERRADARSAERMATVSTRESTRNRSLLSEIKFQSRSPVFVFELAASRLHLKSNA